MKGCMLSLVSVFSLFGFVTATVAYILPPKQILTFMIGHLTSCRTLMVFQKTVLYDPSLENGVQELDGTIYYRYPDQFRSELRAPGVSQIQVVGPDGTLLVVNEKIIGENGNQPDHFKDVLLYRNAESLIERLCQMGIDTETVSLGRFKDKIAYIIGARCSDDSVPQLWIEKNTFRPIRLILRKSDDKDGSLEEIEYTDYKPLGRGNTYPTRILFFENGTLVRMDVAKSFKLNPEISSQLFDFTYLKELYEPIASARPALKPPSELDEVRKSIRDFRKTFE